MTTYTIHDLAYAKGTTEPVREMLLMMNDKAIKQAALIQELLATLEKLARLGNGEHYGNSDGNMIALAAIAKATGGAT